MASPAIQTQSDRVFTGPTHPSRKACPDCGSHRASRSHRQGILERYVLRVLQIRPYRCIICYRRFYRRETPAQQVASKTV
jgi:DNA-directed RNA polymerase subunit RPC12/RpoP